MAECPATARFVRASCSNRVLPCLFSTYACVLFSVGGHIHGARNLCDEEEIDSYFATLCEKVSNQELDPQTTVFIFHCEFSSKRGPRLAKHFRSIDRHSNAHEQWNFGSPLKKEFSLNAGETTTVKKRRQLLNRDTPVGSAGDAENANVAERAGKRQSWTPVTRKLCDAFDTPSPMVLPQSGVLDKFFGSSSRTTAKREHCDSHTPVRASQNAREPFSPLLQRSFSTPVFSPPRQHSPCPVSSSSLTHSPLPAFRLPAAQVLHSSSEKTLLSHEFEVKVSESFASHDESSSSHDTTNEVLRQQAPSVESTAAPMALCSPLKSTVGRSRAALTSSPRFRVPIVTSRTLTPCSKSAPLPDTQSSQQDYSTVLNFSRVSKNAPPIYSKGLLDDVPKNNPMCDSPSSNVFPSPGVVTNATKKRKRSHSKALANHPNGETDSPGLPHEVFSRTKALTISVDSATEAPSPSIHSKKFKRGLTAATAAASSPAIFALKSPNMDGPDEGITFPQVYILDGGYKAFYHDAVRITQVPRYGLHFQFCMSSIPLSRCLNAFLEHSL